MTAAVVVLNASYEHLSVTKLKRAMALILDGRATIEESHPDKWITTPNGKKFPWPKIIRLLKYVKLSVDYVEEPWSRAGVLRRDKYKCVFCGKRGDTVEHIHPTSRGGGERDWLNTAAACVACNGKKGSKTVKEAGLTLLYKPFVPMKFTFKSTKRAKR